MQLPYRSVTTFIARRYLQAGRSSSFFSWISGLTIVGVAIGVAAMIVVWSVINGFEGELRQRFLRGNANIFVYRWPSGLIAESYQEVRAQLQKDYPGEITALAPAIYFETLIRREGVMHGVMVHGIDPRQHAAVQNMAESVRPAVALAQLQSEIDAALPRVKGEGAKAGAPAIIVGVALLHELKAQIGDTVELVEPDAQGLQTMRPFRVVGVYDTGLRQYDIKFVMMSITSAQRFFHMEDRVTGIELALADPWSSTRLASDISERYDGLNVRDWQAFNRSLFEAIKPERAVILLITALVVLVAGFNILTTIFVAVSQRQRDISILKALGTTNRQILVLFLQQGLYIGALGDALGVGLALVICQVLAHYQFVELPEQYMVAHLPLAFDWWIYALCAGVSLVIATVAGIFPAWLASRVDPVAGFKGER